MSDKPVDRIEPFQYCGHLISGIVWTGNHFVRNWHGFLFALAVGGCATAGGSSASLSVPPSMPEFTSADSLQYLPYMAKGAAGVSGQAFLTTRGGDVKKGAGRIVTMDPATGYAAKWFRYTGSGIDKIALAPPVRLFAVTRRTTTADADGKFSFTGLPPGIYMIRSSVTWEIPSTNKYANMQGGTVYEVVLLNDGDTRTVVLNKVLP